MEKWVVKARNDAFKKKLRILKNDNRISLSDFSLEYLVLNGYDTAEKIIKHMYYKECDIPDVRQLSDAELFIKRLKEAYQKNEKIIIYSDYDADGIDAAVIAVRALRKIGADVDYFINNRFTEGYGLSPQGIKRMLHEFPNTKLVVTCDNGIVAFDGIEYAKEQGIDVIVSDHHETEKSGKLPNAIAVVDAHRPDDTYPFKGLCGAGLIFKLMKGLYEELSLVPQDLDYLLPYVAVATVADVVELTEENRYYVKQGLKRIKDEELACFTALNKILLPSNINEETIGYTYAPILNAIGRVRGEVSYAVDFFLEDDEQKCMLMADKMILINEQRKELCNVEKNLSDKMICEEDSLKDGILILASDKFHEGIVGITAGRLKEQYNMPAIIFAIEKGTGYLKGSARSVEGFDMKKAFDMINVPIEKYGGHAAAAGITIRPEYFSMFKKALADLVNSSFYSKVSEPVVRIDFAITEKDINMRMLNALNTELRPFGESFPAPVIGLKEFMAESICLMPNNSDEKKHVKMSTNKLDILWFNGYKQFEQMGMPFHIKAIGTLGTNIYKTRLKYQFIINEHRIRKI